MKEFILKAASEIYKLIADDAKDVLPSVMIDSASKNGRRVFGVFIRYLKNTTIHERVIGVLTQHGHQAGTVLASQIIDMLQKINKSVDDIYSTCSDNGRNMIKASQLLIDAQQQINILSYALEDGSYCKNINHSIFVIIFFIFIYLFRYVL